MHYEELNMNRLIDNVGCVNKRLDKFLKVLNF